MRTRVADIARVANVSRTTVIRALSNSGRISSDTKTRILEIAEMMHYRPNNVARNLTLGETNSVGVVVFPHSLKADLLILEPIAHGLGEAGYTMHFSASAGQLEDERRCLEQLIVDRVAGAVFIHAPSADNLDLCRELLNGGTKIVVIESAIDGLPVPQILPDQYESGRLATEHLISLGHRRIGYLAIPMSLYSGRERYRGFVDAMVNAGIRIEPSLVIETGLSEREGEDAMNRLLNLEDPPTAVIARHDIVAIGAMYAAFTRELRIPEDISIVGVGDIWCSYMLRTPLTTVRHSPIHAAEAGVAKLLEMLGGSEVEPVIETLSGDLIVRSSTSVPRSSPIPTSSRTLTRD